MNFRFIERAVLNYLKAHPEILVKAADKVLKGKLDKVLGEVVKNTQVAGK